MQALQLLGILVFVATLFLVSKSNFFATAQNSLYTPREIAAVAKFRPIVTRFLTQDYQKKDGYLLRWIRVHNFDLKKAAEALEKHAKWRKENDIDSIHTESLAAHNKYLPCKIDGHDRQGRPIMHVPFGKWKHRNYVVAGKQDNALRHSNLCFEKINRAVFERAEATGQDIDEYYLIVDLTGYNVRDNLCLGCVPLSLALAANANSGSAFFAKNATLVNSPRIFQPVLTLMRNLVGSRTAQIISSYDADKNIWQPLLHKDIAPDQLPKSLGGTRPG